MGVATTVKNKKTTIQISKDDHKNIENLTFEKSLVLETTGCSDHQIRAFLEHIGFRDKGEPLSYEVFIIVFILKTLLEIKVTVKTTPQAANLLATGSNLDINKINNSNILKIDITKETNKKTYCRSATCSLSAEHEKIYGWYESTSDKSKVYFINLKKIKETIYDSVYKPSEKEEEPKEIRGD